MIITYLIGRVSIIGHQNIFESRSRELLIITLDQQQWTGNVPGKLGHMLSLIKGLFWRINEYWVGVKAAKINTYQTLSPNTRFIMY